ncbi:GH92 family glycosyl hydrolase [Echinicola rosea]|nr:GH92 family glycosyl hydrolase [Echinicola rosea]
MNYKLMRSVVLAVMAMTVHCQPLSAQQYKVFQLGSPSGNGHGFALYPDGYEDFIAQDFGFEDRIFWIGRDDPQTDFPYVLPGPKDAWGGTGHTAGIRSHFLNLAFELDEFQPTTGQLRIDLADADSLHAAILKVTVNGKGHHYQLKPGKGTALKGKGSAKGKEQLVVVDLPEGLLKSGMNKITLTSLDGSWLAFDHISLSASSLLKVQPPERAVVGEISPASYQTEGDAGLHQPLLVAAYHLEGSPEIIVELDGTEILRQGLVAGEYLLEAPMPVVHKEKESHYKIKLDGSTVKEGTVKRMPQNTRKWSQYVNTLIGAGHSRWMIAPGPWMPFGMVKLSPDNQNSGWQAGYDPTFESIGTFSHIHEWTMAGLGTFPTIAGPVQTTVGDQGDVQTGYRSSFDKQTEQAGIGMYKVHLTDTDIWASLTSTERASMQLYEYGKGDLGRIMIDLAIPSEYRYQIESCEITRVSPTRIEGKSHQLTPDAWSKGVGQDYIVHFVIEFDRPFERFSHWKDGEILHGTDLVAKEPKNAGAFVEFDLQDSKSVKMRTGISYVSIENAAENLSKEISTPFGWDFDAVVAHQRDTWDKLLGRLKVSSNDAREKERFYTNMYRALASRNTFSDVDGRWRDADENIQQLERPDDLALGCDAFWNTFWNLNQFWNLVTPDWSNRWVRSQLAMYDNAGWLAKGPAGMEYIPVMVAEHEIPLIVGAYQMGIRDYDVHKALEAVVKMQSTEATEVGGGFAGNRDLAHYLEYGYVPHDLGRFSNSLEYSFDDWTVGQFAKSLGETSIYEAFDKRGAWWKHVIDPASGYARMKNAKGEWLEDFDPFRSGANHHYVEGNAWQLTFFVPQDVPGLMEAIGKEKFLERLEWGFSESDRWRFNGPNDQYWDFPVVQGNQQSMHFAFLFNYAGKPWLTQKWSRAIMDRYYGHGVTNAYLGDEDQGQMSAWFIMASLGLFQVDGGTRASPIYEIGSPLFGRVEIDLGNRFGRGETFTIRAVNADRKNIYVQKATLNGKPLNRFWFEAASLLKGGELVLEMGDTPNEEWGNTSLPY